MEAMRRFDNELSIARGLVELKRQGVEFERLEAELTRLGPVDLDLLGKIRNALKARISRTPTTGAVAS